MIYTTRQEAAEACIREAEATERYSKEAINAAKSGDASNAWSAAETARMTAQSALNAHEILRVFAGKNMTDEEFNAFRKAEIAQRDATKAEKIAAKSLARQIIKSIQKAVDEHSEVRR